MYWVVASFSDILPGKMEGGSWSWQPIPGQYENMWVMTLSKMAATCHKMEAEIKWWPLCIQWEGASCFDILLG